MTLTMTLPDRLGQALINKANEFGQAHTDYLRSMMFASTQSPTGVVLKLEMPPLQAELDAAQPLLPLGGARRRLSEWLNLILRPYERRRCPTIEDCLPCLQGGAHSSTGHTPCRGGHFDRVQRGVGFGAAVGAGRVHEQQG